MPLQATSGAASYDAFGGGVAAVPNYIEDVFSTYLIKTPGSATAVGAVNNAIDLSTKGGMVWLKDRNFAYPHTLVDSARGVTQRLRSDSTNAQASTSTYGVTSFNTNGFTLGDGGGALFDNGSAGTNLASWTFRKQKKFFDVVTWTGDGASSKTISHNLGATPGCIITKSVSYDAGVNDSWYVYHRSLTTPDNKFLQLSSTNGVGDIGATMWNVTSTTFRVFRALELNTSGQTYVAYLFAHDAGGFGLTGTDNVISCGSYVGSNTTDVPLELGFEPQFVMIKNITTGGTDWYMADTMRGMAYSGIQPLLAPNLSDAETGYTGTFFKLRSTGMDVKYGSGTAICAASQTYIYIAIRRGPMKVPTSGTSVFSPVARAGTGANATITSGFVTDLSISQIRSGSALGAPNGFFDRLRGATKDLSSNTSDAEITYSDSLTSFASNTGITVGADSASGAINYGGTNYGQWFFRRAPSFFDEVCYTGTGANRTLSHNLQAVPELIICKMRSGTDNWAVYSASTGATKFLILNLNFQAITESTVWNNTSPTSTQFTVGTNTNSNGSGSTYVAYLFATCPGVQYINSYVGDGTTGRTINCGFTGGARFVCIKATSTSGSWWTFDSARGIVTNSDPALQLNSTAAEVTSADAIDTASSGFIVNQEATCSLNASGVSYLVWAIA